MYVEINEQDNPGTSFYLYKKAISIMRVIFNFILDYSNKKEDDLVWRDACFLENRFLCLCCQ